MPISLQIVHIYEECFFPKQRKFIFPSHREMELFTYQYFSAELRKKFLHVITVFANEKTFNPNAISPFAPHFYFRNAVSTFHGHVHLTRLQEGGEIFGLSK